ncbi:MAG: Rrf2 family transcriptional regulator [Tepidisphaeraceae bacterium]
MRLSKRTEYGIRAIVRLAQLGPAHYVQSRDLAGLEEIPPKFLEAILLALRRGGFLESKVGSGGGYRLSREARDIPVGDLVRRLEGRLTIKDKSEPSTTDITGGKVAVRLLNDKLTEATDQVLDQMTLEQLVDHVNRAATGHQAMYYI